VKRKELLKKITELGATFLRHGGNHDVYIKGKIYKSNRDTLKLMNVLRKV